MKTLLICQSKIPIFMLKSTNDHRELKALVHKDLPKWFATKNLFQNRLQGFSKTQNERKLRNPPKFQTKNPLRSHKSEFRFAFANVTFGLKKWAREKGTSRFRESTFTNAEVMKASRPLQKRGSGLLIPCKHDQGIANVILANARCTRTNNT